MPSLLTVTGGRIDLEANRCYVIGRGADSDIVVSDPASSRRHARLTVGGSGESVWVDDLGSRNGTFVNDEPVDERRLLSDGCRLRVGSALYLFTQLGTPEGHERLAEACTVTTPAISLDATLGVRSSRPGDRGAVAAFTGQLSSFGIIEILQLLVTTHRSGTLHVELADGRARVEVRNGDVLAASYAELHGFPALLMLARQENGIFWLSDNKAKVQRTVHERPQSLVMELCRALDELKQKAGR